jgi:hypothetical protein
MLSRQLSFWANVSPGKCLSGQLSLWANVLLGKRLFGKCLSGQMSFWANVLLGKCRKGKCHGTLLDTDLIGSFILVTVGFEPQFSEICKGYYRMMTMFQIKIIMLLSLLGSVAAGHRTIRFLFILNG